LIGHLISIIDERTIFLNYWRKHFGNHFESNKSNDHHANNKTVSYNFKELFFNLLRLRGKVNNL